jgi:hypothetical protein
MAKYTVNEFDKTTGDILRGTYRKRLPNVIMSDVYYKHNGEYKVRPENLTMEVFENGSFLAGFLMNREIVFTKAGNGYPEGFYIKYNYPKDLVSDK